MEGEEKSNALQLFYVWSCGRVARLSSAKAATAVRIRTGPLIMTKPPVFLGVLFFRIPGYSGKVDHLIPAQIDHLKLTV